MQFTIEPPPQLDQDDLERLRSAAAKLAARPPVARIVGWIEETCHGLGPWDLDLADWSRQDYFDSVSALAWLLGRMDHEPTLAVLDRLLR